MQRSIIGHGVRVHDGADIQESIIMDHTIIGKGARLRRAIVDRFNIIDAGETVGYDQEKEGSRQDHLDPSGLVVRARGVTRWV